MEHRLLVQSKTSREIAHARSQNGIGKQIGTTADELALEIPAENAAVTGISGTGDDVEVALLLEGNHLGDELGVVGEVGVHDDNEVASDELQAVNVGRTEAKLSSARLEVNVGRVGLDELLGDFLRAVRGAIVNNDDFPVQVTTGTC